MIVALLFLVLLFLLFFGVFSFFFPSLLPCISSPQWLNAVELSSYRTKQTQRAPPLNSPSNTTWYTSMYAYTQKVSREIFIYMYIYIYIHISYLYTRMHTVESLSPKHLQLMGRMLLINSFYSRLQKLECVWTWDDLG